MSRGDLYTTSQAAAIHLIELCLQTYSRAGNKADAAQLVKSIGDAALEMNKNRRSRGYN
jgi:hypothetical protein